MKEPDAVLLPFLDAPQMRALDRIMVDDYGIQLIQMMESAGRNLAHLTRYRFLAGEPIGKRIAILAGPGGNGGGVLAAARRLHGWGARVNVFLPRAIADLAPVTQQQARILQRLAAVCATEGAGIPAPGEAFDAVLDGLIGYGLRGPPRGTTAQLISWANGQHAPIIALDVPSGVDASSGLAHEPAIRARATMTLALPKKGLALAGAKARTGELYVADIGVPPEVYARSEFGLEVGPVFAHSDIVRLW